MLNLLLDGVVAALYTDAYISVIYCLLNAVIIRLENYQLLGEVGFVRCCHCVPYLAEHYSDILLP